MEVFFDPHCRLVGGGGPSEGTGWEGVERPRLTLYEDKHKCVTDETRTTIGRDSCVPNRRVLNRQWGTLPL